MVSSTRHLPSKRLFLALLLAMAIELFAAAASSTFHRLSNDPVLAPVGSGWESAGTFNPAAIRRDGTIIVVYRAPDAKGTSRIGYAHGIHFMKRAEPVLVPETNYEGEGGVEDPPLVEIGGVHYLT